MLASGDSFFFDQLPYRQSLKRYKKNADELPQSLRYAHLNPKLASFYKDSKNGDEEGAGDAEGGGVKDSILPEISSTFTNIRNQILSGVMPDYDSTRLALQQSKTVTPILLEELSRLLPLVKLSRKKLSYPRSLEHHLQCTYVDLVYDAKYVKRRWQLLENQVKYDAEQKEKAQKEAAASQADDTKKSKADLSDSDGERAKAELSDTEQGGRRSKSHRKKHRFTQSQPAVIIEGTPSRKGSTGRKSRSGSALRKPGTAPGRQDNNRLTVQRGAGELDAVSEASHSIKSGLPSAHPQPYSMTVLAFNLSDYHTWEDKGCHVFGIEKSEENDHPLEWVVKRLNQTSSAIKLEQAEANRLRCTELPYTRYYTDSFNEKCMAKSTVDRLGIFNTVMKGGKPKIPNLKPKPNKAQIFCTQITDGSKTFYYETGELAVVTCRGSGQGFYTLCHDREDGSKMLASFTPQGTGCCYSMLDSPRLLVTEAGGFFTADEEEVVEWQWPPGANTKLSSPISVSLNRYLSIKVVSRASITLTFQSASHSIKLPLGHTDGLSASNLPPSDESLLMGDKVVYTSHMAQEMLQRQKLSKGASLLDRQPTTSVLKKNRLVKTPKKEDTPSVDFSEAPTVVQFDMNKVERDFGRLKNKAKAIVEDWLDAYRVALGMASPQMKNMKLTADWCRQGLHTAKSLPPDSQSNNADELASTPIPQILDSERSARVPSAPSGFGPWMYPTEGIANDLSAPRLSAREKSASNTLRVPNTAPTQLKLPAHDSKSIISSDVPTLQGLMSEWTVANHYQCPVALRNQLLGYHVSGPHICKCTRRRVPYITDVELETFISQIVPRKQLTVISIVSSLFPEKNGGGEMLDRLHCDRNANRANTCMQSRSDSYRLFRYDVVTSYFDTNHTQPLLLSRHNAVPGMFLIFQAGKLIFCDHIFNGYGNAKQDFQKQLVDCRRLAFRGFSLPRDFKFSPQKGRQGLRSPWGGQIGGAGVDKYGNPGTTTSMPLIERKESCQSPDSVSTLEYHIGRNLNKESEEDVYTTKSLVSKLSKKYARIVPPAAIIR